MTVDEERLAAWMKEIAIAGRSLLVAFWCCPLGSTGTWASPPASFWWMNMIGEAEYIAISLNFGGRGVADARGPRRA
jgi:hypothetical protein